MRDHQLSNWWKMLVGTGREIMQPEEVEEHPGITTSHCGYLVVQYFLVLRLLLQWIAEVLSDFALVFEKKKKGANLFLS
jgi:hypothetical protein